MIKSTSAIVLNVVKYNDSSSILKVISEHSGMMSLMVKGINAKKNKKLPYFQPLSIVSIEYKENLKGGLHHLKSINGEYAFISIPFHIYKSSIVMFLTEFFNKCLKEDSENDWFYWLKESLIRFDTTPYNPNFHLFMMVNTIKKLGFLPQLNHTESTPYFDLSEGCFINKETSGKAVLNKKESHLFYLLFKGTIFDEKTPNFNYQERKQLLQALTKYFQLHLSSFEVPKSLAVLEAVLTD